MVRLTSAIGRLFTANNIAPPDVRLFVKFDSHHDARGIINAMECLIERNGLVNLQQLGVASECDDTDRQSTSKIPLDKRARMLTRL
jgi:hypothetical protein